MTAGCLASHLLASLQTLIHREDLDTQPSSAVAAQLVVTDPWSCLTAHHVASAAKVHAEGRCLHSRSHNKQAKPPSVDGYIRPGQEAKSLHSHAVPNMQLELSNVAGIVRLKLEKLRTDCPGEATHCGRRAQLLQS